MNAKDAMLAELKTRNPALSLEQNSTPTRISTASTLRRSFYRDWLFAGHDCEIPGPGGLFHHADRRLSDPNRAWARRFDPRAPQFLPASRFANCAMPKGTVKRLVCPFISGPTIWTEDCSAHVTWTRRSTRRNSDSSPSIAKASAATSSYASRPWRQVSNPFRAQAEGYLAPHKIADAKIAFESTIVETAIGSSSGKTTASATIARRTIRNCAGRIRRRPA